MKYTDKLNLNLPEYTDTVDIENINANFIAIDDQIATVDEIKKYLGIE